MVLHWVTHVDQIEDSAVVCTSCQTNINKHTITTASRHDFGRQQTKYGPGVTTDITAGKKATKNDKQSSDLIPMGKIACRIETVQDRRDLESLETADCSEYPGKSTSTDQINELDTK